MPVDFADDDASVQILEPSWLFNDRGTPVPDYDRPASNTLVGGCIVLPGASTEALAGQRHWPVRWTVWLPPGTPITAASRVMFNGNSYSVDGEPVVLRSPTQLVGHIEALLVDWRG